MNPSEVVYYVCGKCKLVHETADEADRCCYCSSCGVELPLPASGSSSGQLCRGCWVERRDRRYADLLLAAAEVSDDYDGPVFLEGFGSGNCGDGCWSSLDDLIEHLEDLLACGEIKRTKWPSRAFCAEKVPVELSVDSVLESALDDHHESVDPNGIDDLTKAVASFNAANRSVVSYLEDTSRCVLVPLPSEPTSV